MKKSRSGNHCGIVRREPRLRSKYASINLLCAVAHCTNKCLITCDTASKDDPIAVVFGSGAEGLFDKRSNERILKSSRYVVLVALDVVTRIYRIKDSSLESAERELVIVLIPWRIVSLYHRPGEAEASRVSILRESFDVTSAGIGKPHQLCDFVECFARSVVSCRAQ